jgi:hypothetical protein
MKSTLILLALVSGSFADVVVKPRVTAAQIAKLRERSPMPATAPAAPTGFKVARPEHQSIIAQSTILHDGKNWTLVPTNAVVFLPEALKSRVNVKPVGHLLSWQDFLAGNRSWITTNEVTFDQAAGAEPLPAERAAFWAQQDKLVVAVHQNGPISVRIATASATTLTSK